MSMNPASDHCTLWLQNSLRRLKADELEEMDPPADLVLSRQQLLAALYGRDLMAAQRICEEFDEIGGGSNSSVRDLILPSVYSVEHEWLLDRRDFNDTLTAFWFLQQLLERPKNRSKHQPAVRSTALQGLTVFAAAPGCEHNLGVLVVSHHFRSWGWQVKTLLEGRREVLVREVSSQPIDFLGLSVGHDAGLAGMPELIHELRTCSRNPGIKILLGGNIFDMSAPQYAWIGADCLAKSPEDAFEFCVSMAQHRTH